MKAGAGAATGAATGAIGAGATTYFLTTLGKTNGLITGFGIAAGLALVI